MNKQYVSWNGFLCVDVCFDYTHYKSYYSLAKSNIFLGK